MVARKRKLTPKQKRFVVEYLKDSNGTRAAIEAGFSPKRAREIAWQLLHKTTHVMEAIQREEEDHLRKVGVQADKVLTRMARLGFADIRKLFGPNNTLKDVEDWPDDIVPAVASVEVFEEYKGKGEDRVLIGHTKKVRLWDPNPSLTNMAKNLGVIGNGKHRDEDEVEEGGRALTTLELSARLVYLVKLAVERKKEIEAQKALSGKSQDEKPKELLK